MPTYDYSCELCDHEFDSIRSIANRLAPEEEPCPECGAKRVKFKISVPLNSYMDPHRLGRLKHNDDFKESMRQIKKGNPDQPRMGLKNGMKDYS